MTILAIMIFLLEKFFQVRVKFWIEQGIRITMRERERERKRESDNVCVCVCVSETVCVRERRK